MRIWSLFALRRCLHFALSAVHLVVAVALAGFKSRAALQLENVALRHQLSVLQRSVKKPKLTAPDRLLWAWLCGVWGNWRSALIIVKPETVITWHRWGFRLFWRWKIRRGRCGHPYVPKDVRQLIRTMSLENPLWGSPRIHGELLKLGIDVGQTSVGRYMVRLRKPPSQTCKAFLDNHVKAWCRSIFSLFRRFGSRSSTCSWRWLMTVAGFSISMSRLIRRPSGPASNCGRLSRLTRFHGTYFAIAMAFSATISPGKSRSWALAQQRRRWRHFGRTGCRYQFSCS